MSHQIEEGLTLNLDFEKLPKAAQKCSSLIPVSVQSSQTKEVLILAYVSPESLAMSLDKKIAVFYSTSRNELWEKGKTSGDTLKLDEVLVNCEQNALVFLVTPEKGGACHTQHASGKTRRSCFYRKLTSPTQLEFINQ